MLAAVGLPVVRLIRTRIGLLDLLEHSAELGSPGRIWAVTPDQVSTEGQGWGSRARVWEGSNKISAGHDHCVVESTFPCRYSVPDGTKGCLRSPGEESRPQSGGHRQQMRCPQRRHGVRLALIPAGSRPALIPVGGQLALIPAGSRPALIPAGSRPALIPVGSQIALIPVGSRPALIPARSLPLGHPQHALQMKLQGSAKEHKAGRTAVNVP
jgi:hypothetical protein